MAGCYVSLNESSLDHSEIVSKLQPADPCSNFDASRKSCSMSKSTKLRQSLKRHPSLLNYFRPLSPMLGNRQFVELLKLYCDVKEKAGYDAISKSEPSGLLAEEHGLGTGIRPPLKLLFLKYLDTLGRAYENLAAGKGLQGHSFCTSAIEEALMELETGFKCFVSEFAKEIEKKKEGFPKVGKENIELSFTDGMKEDNNLHNLNTEKSEITATNVGSSDLSENEKSSTDVDAADTGLNEKVANSSANSSVSEKDGEDINFLDSNNAEKVYSRKRKRASLSGILSWISNVAKNPTDPAVGEVPKISSWKSHKNDECWMQVLAAREALFLKRPEVSSCEQPISQKRQKMHPSMFEDDTSRSHSRLSSGKILKAQAPSGASSSSSPSDAESSLSPSMEGTEDQQEKRLLRSHYLVDSICSRQAQKRIPTGRSFQAEIPECTGTESDSKWLGTRVWPIEKREHTLIERDPMGKGRQDSCGCEFPGSIECVRFHIGEKRKKVKLELGAAFYQWKFDEMGEEVALSWTEKDEKRFKDVAKSNPQSVDMSFWEKLMKKLPKKSREDLVSYYYNVFLLQRRGYQNRHTPSDIDSDDDDEAEHAAVTNVSGSETAKPPAFASLQKKGQMNM